MLRHTHSIHGNLFFTDKFCLNFATKLHQHQDRMMQSKF
ncbi:hypothetical protein CAter282_0370 [Collimonas arenae]|uniref:Uncharacterized protein n=1 Tax=Collimonas arenae TaxID=279058 RepID=A0A127PLK9_9BURK|nr:hypothetical protein CAter10_0393 [Collimonas arenae]AMP08188.1 hypothetical protein CAter282_0370 [Collimonas arenae]